MAKEIETKIINIDVAELKRSLKKNKASFIGKFFYKRWIFDLTKRKGEEEYLRVRTDGKTSTLTYKFRKGKGLRNTEEIEIEVSDFSNAVALLSKLFHKKYYQESRRELYGIGNAEICINYWPKVRPFVEIEGKSVKDVEKTIKLLNIKGRELGNVSMVKIYEMQNINVHAFKRLTF